MKLDKDFISDFIYKTISNEIKSRSINERLWVRALDSSDNDIDVAKAEYIRLRFIALKKQLDEELLFEKKENRKAELKAKEEKALLEKKQKDDQARVDLYGLYRRRASLAKSLGFRRHMRKIGYALAFGAWCIFYLVMIFGTELYPSESEFVYIISSGLLIAFPVGGLGYIAALVYIQRSGQYVVEAEIRSIDNAIRNIQKTALKYYLSKFIKAIMAVLIIIITISIFNSYMTGLGYY